MHQWMNPLVNYVSSPIGTTMRAFTFYPAALKGSGVLSYPERAGGRADGRAGGRQGRQAPLTLSCP